MTDHDSDDEKYMRLALEQAEIAGQNAEVPVGAVIVRDGTLLAAAPNASRATSDPTGHAEILALRAAAASVQNYRLPGTTLYVTVEPCAMCVGAMLHARVERLVFGANEPRTGAAGSVVDLTGEPEFNHRIAVTRGVLGDVAAQQMKAFFAARRNRPEPGAAA